MYYREDFACKGNKYEQDQVGKMLYIIMVIRCRREKVAVVASQGTGNRYDFCKREPAAPPIFKRKERNDDNTFFFLFLKLDHGESVFCRSFYGDQACRRPV
jgi:hypothetical protein